MALPREVFLEKMRWGREQAELRRQQERKVDGTAEVPQSALPAQPNEVRRRNGGALGVPLSDVRRGRSKRTARVAPPLRARGGGNAPPSVCQECLTFHWESAGLELMEARAQFLQSQVARAAEAINRQYARQAAGCSVCGLAFDDRHHYYTQKVMTDAATGKQKVYRVCSRPCYIQLPEKYPELRGKLT